MDWAKIWMEAMGELTRSSVWSTLLDMMSFTPCSESSWGCLVEPVGDFESASILEQWETFLKAEGRHIHKDMAKGSTNGRAFPLSPRRAPSNPRVTRDRLTDQTSWEREGRLCANDRDSFSIQCWRNADGRGWKTLWSRGKGWLAVGWKNVRAEKLL